MGVHDFKGFMKHVGHKFECITYSAGMPIVTNHESDNEMVESMLDINLEDVTGIGPKTKEKLNDGGIESVLDSP